MIVCMNGDDDSAPLPATDPSRSSGQPGLRTIMRRVRSHRKVLVTLALLTLAEAAPAVASAPHRTQRESTHHAGGPRAATETYTYRGEVAQKVTVPAGVDVAQVRAVGGRGAGVGQYAEGGYGAQITGTIDVVPGQVLTLKVAGRGKAPGNRQGGAGGWGAEGYGGRGGNSTISIGGGGGGGATGVELADCGTCSDSAVLTAAGGGGAGGRGFEPSIDRGGHGGTSASVPENGYDGHGPGAGTGGVGAREGGLKGGGGGGGTGTDWGGGGGGGGAGAAGGYGGDGAGAGAGGGGGGGAGSSQYTTKLTGAKVGGGVTGDGDGLVELTWIPAPQTCRTQTVYVPRNSTGITVQLRCDGAVPPGHFATFVLPAHGRIENLDPQKGTFTYVPDAGYRGRDYAGFHTVSAGITGPVAGALFEVGAIASHAAAHGR